MIRNAPKHQFRVQWCGSGAFGAKNSDAASFSNFCTSSARFAPRFVWQPNGPKCTQRVQNAPNRQFRVQWRGSGAFVAKNSNATSWHELLHSFGPFCIEFRKATKQPVCTQIVRNEPNRQFRVQWRGSGAFIAKYSDATTWHELLH